MSGGTRRAIYLVLVLMVLTAFAGRGVHAQSSDWQVVTGNGYQYQLPADWHQRGTSDPAIDSNFVSSGFDAFTIVQIEDMSPLTPDPVQFLTSFLNDVAQNELSGAVITPAAAYPTAGADAGAAGIDTYTDVGGITWQVTAIAGTSGSVLYLFTDTETLDYASAHATDDPMLVGSFQITGQPAPVPVPQVPLPAPTVPPPAPAPAPAVQPAPTVAPAPVAAPAPPAGATALCNDGTYSFSQHRRGTCSSHDGVRQFLVSLPP